MQKCLVIVTNDGKMHESEKDARKHLDARYADLLCPLSHRLTLVTYTVATEILHESLEILRRMVEIQDERKDGITDDGEE